MIICPKCGAEMSDSAKFCRKCGTRIDGEIAEGAAEKNVDFEEPVDGEDGTVDFNWEQPVEVEEVEVAGRKEETAGAGEDKQEENEASETYEWGPPMGSDEEEGSEMMPLQVGKPRDEIEAYEEGSEYGYGAEGVIPPWDHTHKFDPDDISENKVVAMAAYLLGPIGVIIALIAAQNSPYAGFHVRQSLKFIVLEALTSVVMLLLCWTFIVPAAGAIFLIVLWVLKIMAFISICKGKALEPPILRSLKFLK